MQGSAAQGAGNARCGLPMSSTLIHGASEAVLVDTLVTNDQVDALVDWIEGFDLNLTTIYIAHGHADHWIGLARLLRRFPNARGLATPEVVGRANLETTHPPLAAYWQSIFRHAPRSRGAARCSRQLTHTAGAIARLQNAYHPADGGTTLT
jgi:glyoxylase-like metal-dependent hydrolase (beta-lactamase superfamily II)